MPSLGFVRGVLLFMSVLALLTATVLDGIMMRHVVQPLVSLALRRGDGVVRPPAPLQFMLRHAWARRVYHLLAAALLFGFWWRLGATE